jgi:hypothetical protein
MKYLEELIKAISSEDFYETEEVLEKIIRDDESVEYVEAILKYMEENPYIDYGMPGPVVHYMEKYYKKGYEKLLYESLSNKPTPHTVWMLNRLINDPSLPEKEEYMSLLCKISDDDSIDESVRNDAKHFLDYQNNK